MRKASLPYAAIAIASAMLLQGCGGTPIGPTVMAVPPAGKAFAAFQLDQHDCSLLAGQAIRPMLDGQATDALATAVLTTAAGAALGAAVGGGHGAGVGALAGSLVGGTAADGQANQDSARIQASYDQTYGACMSSRGDVLAPSVQQVVVNVQAAPASR